MNEIIDDALAGRRVPWWGLVDAVTGPGPGCGEERLLEALRFDGRLDLADDPELHSLSPEDMLKSLAGQTLVKLTGAKYVAELERAAGESGSSVLASIFRAAIRAAGA